MRPGLTIAGVVAFWVFLATGIGLAAKERVTDNDRFYLWLNCRPVNLAVSVAGKDAHRIKLREKAVAVTVRSKLRVARLYSGNESLGFDGLLAVNVTVAGAAFAVELSLLHFVTRATLVANPLEISGMAVIWEHTVIGTHGGSADYILSAVARSMDGFIDEYLRVNATACSRR